MTSTTDETVILLSPRLAELVSSRTAEFEGRRVVFFGNPNRYDSVLIETLRQSGADVVIEVDPASHKGLSYTFVIVDELSTLSSNVFHDTNVPRAAPKKPRKDWWNVNNRKKWSR